MCNKDNDKCITIKYKAKQDYTMIWTSSELDMSLIN